MTIRVGLFAEPGTVPANRCRIPGLPGRGGMGEVYKAEDFELHQTVALRFQPESFAEDNWALALFRGEGRNDRAFSHPNVCRVFDIGEADGADYLIFCLLRRAFNRAVRSDRLSSILLRPKRRSKRRQNCCETGRLCGIPAGRVRRCRGRAKSSCSAGRVPAPL